MTVCSVCGAPMGGAVCLNTACPQKQEPDATEPPLAPVLRLVPQPVVNTESKRAQCRRILLEALQRLEEGEFEEIVLVTINSKGLNPYTLRWHFTDPVRVAGVLDFGRQHILTSFVRMT